MKYLLLLSLLTLGCATQHRPLLNDVNPTWEVTVRHFGCDDMQPLKVRVTADTGAEAEARALLIAQQSCEHSDEGTWETGPVIKN